MVQASAAAQITHLIGFPEALFPLTQATIYLARAPKSNAVLRAYSAANSDAVETAREPVPLHLRNAVTPLMKHIGYGKDYRYVHGDRTAKDEMECLPEKLRGKVYFKEEQSSEESNKARGEVPAPEARQKVAPGVSPGISEPHEQESPRSGRQK
jgi:putative ATPase